MLDVGYVCRSTLSIVSRTKAAWLNVGVMIRDDGTHDYQQSRAAAGGLFARPESRISQAQ